MTKPSTPSTTPELSRPVDVGHLEEGEEIAEKVTANVEERAALARRFDLQAVDRLDADLRLLRRGRDIEVSGSLRAEAIQTCVVSLDPLPVTIELDIIQVYDPDVRPTGEFDELLEVNDEDPPEPLVDETVDVGELVAERFGLALDPYPRKEGATVDPRYLAGGDKDQARESPFAVLKALKR